MGVAVPATLFFLLDLETGSQFFTIAATTFLCWGVADLLAGILEKPRLRGRIGHLDLLDMAAIDRAIRTQLAL